MESHAQRVILELLVDLQFKASRGALAPDFNGFVRGASCNQVLLDADVHAVNGSRVERMHQVFVDRLNVLVIEQTDRHLVNLVVLRRENQCVFT